MPADLSAGTDEPTWLPETFHPVLLSYAKARAFEALEDNDASSERYDSAFDLGVAELKRHRTRSASSSGAFQMRVSGVTA